MVGLRIKQLAFTESVTKAENSVVTEGSQPASSLFISLFRDLISLRAVLSSLELAA